MAPDTSRVQELLDTASRLGGAEERRRFLAEACGDNTGLRDEVHSLLAALLASDDFLERGPVSFSVAPGESAGEFIDRYRLVEVLGEGGFGVVWRARQERPVRRDVALKIVKPGMDSPHVLARFASEQQALALLEHAGIARVYDAGVTPRGRPYFAMELVDGRPLTAYCDEHRLDVRRRVALAVDVCEAIHHAHQRGILHRDLKPSNVLVADVDGRPVPKVIDFGVAKALRQPLHGEPPLLTEDGHWVGTPAYMSPEQLGRGASLDTRSDLYSVGVLLYELLTGTTPLRVSPGKRLSPAAIERRATGEEAEAPVARLDSLDGATLAQVARARSATPAELRRAVRGDLSWVVGKCLEIDPARRYPSAAHLAEDLRRHLAGLPVEAGPPGAAYRLGKTLRRNRVWVTAGAAVAAALVAGLAAATYGLVAARTQRDLARTETAKSESMNGFLQQMLAAADPDRAGGNEATVRQVLDEAARRLDDHALDGQPEVEAGARVTLGRTYVSLGLSGPAERQLRRALELRRGTSAAAASPTAVAENLYLIGTALQVRRDAAGAAEFYRQSLEAFRAAGAADHPAYAACMTDYGIVLEWQKDLAGSEAALREALRRCEGAARAGGRDARVQAARCTHCLARVLWVRGDYDAAEEHYRRALAAYQALLGHDHRQTAMAAQDLGGFLMWVRHDLAGAEPLLTSAMATGQHLLGPDHPHTNRFRKKLAVLRTLQGNTGEADRLWRDFCRIELNLIARQLAENPGDAVVVDPPATRGPAYRPPGSNPAGDEPSEFQQIMVATPDDPGVLVARARVLTLLGRYDEAVADYDRLIARNASDGYAYGCRGCLHERAGRYPDALRDLTHATEAEPTAVWWWCHRAALHLLLGDAEGYRACRAELLGRFASTGDLVTAENTCRASLLAPPADRGGAEGARPATLSSLPIRGVDENLHAPLPPHYLSWMWMTKGMFEYRSGHFESAAEWSARARDAYGPDAAAASATAEAFLAMSHWQLGRREEAAEDLKKAIARAPAHPPRPEDGDLSIRMFDAIVFRITRREAERTLSGAPAEGTGG